MIENVIDFGVGFYRDVNRLDLNQILAGDEKMRALAASVAGRAVGTIAFGAGFFLLLSGIGAFGAGAASLVTGSAAGNIGFGASFILIGHDEAVMGQNLGFVMNPQDQSFMSAAMEIAAIAKSELWDGVPAIFRGTYVFEPLIFSLKRHGLIT